MKGNKRNFLHETKATGFFTFFLETPSRKMKHLFQMPVGGDSWHNCLGFTSMVRHL